MYNIEKCLNVDEFMDFIWICIYLNKIDLNYLETWRVVTAILEWKAKSRYLSILAGQSRIQAWAL